MSFISAALSLAARGFHVFPVVPDSKLPAIDAFPVLASRDPEQIKRWWIDPVMGEEQPYNVGISTSAFGDNAALVVIDIDNKGDKHGDQELLKLELSGLDFPPTFTQLTPTGGRHLVYQSPRAVTQGVNRLAPGLDIRSAGGYIVGEGSELSGRFYSANTLLPAEAPSWLIEKLGVAADKKTAAVVHKPASIDQDAAAKRASDFLSRLAPATAGGRNHAGFAAAAKLKDFGVSETTALYLMASEWKCEPALEGEELAHVVRSAYKYGKDDVGSSAPEVEFSEIGDDDEKLHPFRQINKDFAFVVAGGGSHILWETKGPKNEFRLEHLALQAFHQMHASWHMAIGDGKVRPVTELWMKSPDRRSYDGICFMPGLDAPPRFYNLWRGFSVTPHKDGEPITAKASHALQSFLDHAKINVCRGDEALFKWLMGYFAHLIQKPWEKPLVAIVFRGKKGVGKNALIERVGELINNHFMVTSDKRYLLGNFNGYLEHTLMMVLDEAFWSGDKQAEGILKNLITGKMHIIEHKGKEPYSVENCTRVAIIGNEDWLVPASQDERRFAVFDVGEGRKQDRSFFHRMREGMQAGGYRLLLRYFLDFDLNQVDVNAAPATAALMDQKVASLDPFFQWWLECLTEGRIVGSEMSMDWPTEFEKDRFRNAFVKENRERQIRSRLPDAGKIGRLLAACAPSVDVNARSTLNGDRIRLYRFPSLAQARLEWERFIGHEVQWE